MRLVEKYGNQTRASESTGLNQTWLSKLINGTMGGSYRSAGIIARELGVHVADLIGGGYVPETLTELPGYRKALIEARATGQFTDTVWEMVGNMTIAPLEAVDAGILLHVAAMVQASRVRKATSGSDTSPPSRPDGGGHRRSASKLRKR